MIPEAPGLSSVTVRGRYLPPFPKKKEALADYARGGVDFEDASQGLNKKDWYGYVKNGKFYVSAEGVSEKMVLATGANVDWFSFSFDQNMRLCCAYGADKKGYLYWYNTAIHGGETIELGEVSSPTIRLDDISDAAYGESELILSYIKKNSLYIRLQRDRFLVEYLVKENVGNDLIQCGFTSVGRFQWDITIIYPRHLPCPQSDLDLVPRERRYISDITDVRNLRPFQREFQGTHNKISFVYTEEEVADFREWYNQVLIHGGGWFYADWPVLHTDKNIAHRFVGQPTYEWLFGGNPGAKGRSSGGYVLGATPSAVPVYKVSATIEVYERKILQTFTSKLYPYYFDDDVTASNIDALAYMPPRIRLEDDIQAAPIFISYATMKEWIFSKYAFEDDITATPISIKEVRTNGWKYSTYSFSDDIATAPITITDVKSTGWGYLDYSLTDDITASQITITAGVIS